ncbi:hypothetical protein [Coleofasciculus chthonoplastes]|uniref:hypothetical protein n=1 Tax=Coleofasciculus chthonoplastes TaxID=64178 RepID=UPI0032F96298
MSYCNNSVKALVTYTFKGESNSKKRFETKKTPIEVEAGSKPIPAGENYNAEGFEIYFYSPNNRRWIRSIVQDYLIYPISSPGRYSQYNYAGIAMWGCGQSDFQRVSDGTVVGPGIDVDSLQIDTSVKCPVPPVPMESICHLKVLHQGIVIHQDQGECPVNWTIDCDPCPPNTIRCVEGGKVRCVPCSELLNPLKQITSKLKQINNG